MRRQAEIIEADYFRGVPVGKFNTRVYSKSSIGAIQDYGAIDLLNKVDLQKLAPGLTMLI